MGRILTPAVLTEANIRDYISNSTKQYSTFFKGTPTFCTYYSKENFSSNHEKSLLNVSEIIGKDSPIRFNKIENLPIYSVETSSFSTSITDFGIAGDVSSSAIVLPRTIIPSSDDIFVLKYQSTERVFIVTDVEYDNFNNDRYYKISFKFSQHSLTDVDKQIDKELTVDYSLIGKTENPLVEKSHYDLYLQLENTFDVLYQEYKDRFYDDSICMFSKMESDGTYYVDHYLNAFIVKNSLASKYKSYRDFSYLDMDINKLGRTREYSKSVYRSFENWSFNEIDTTQKFIKVAYKDTRYSVDWFSKKSHISNLVHQDGLYLLTPDFILSAKQDESVIIEPCFRKFIGRVVRNEYNDQNYKDVPADIGTPDYDKDDYYLIPFVLYSLNKIRSLVINKNEVKV